MEKNAAEAQSICQSNGGHLFEPQTLSINDQIYNKAREIMGDGKYLWIGINDIQTEGTWVYSSNSATIPYVHPWREGEPNNASIFRRSFHFE